jgi:exodeoxyribonuclease-3
MALRLVTWNVNSVRLRIAALRTTRGGIQSDVLSQETKVMDDSFPGATDRLGYRHTLVHGMKSPTASPSRRGCR